MNDLDLPPRRTLPPEVRDRIRAATAVETPRSWTVRYRAPLSVAAAVAVLVAGAVVVGQSVAGTPDGFRTGTTPPSSGVAPTSVPPDASSTEDLDHCGSVAAASPRAQEFAPRAEWTPVFTVVQGDVRLTAFRDSIGKPGFCEVDGTTATVSDPSAEPMVLAGPTAGTTPVEICGLYLSPSGLMAGVAEGVAGVGYFVTVADPEGGPERLTIHPIPIFQDGLFVLDLGQLTPGTTVEVSGYDGAGNGVADGTWTYDPAKVRPVGATGTF